MPELSASVVVPRGVVGLTRPEESSAIDDDSQVVARGNRAATVLSAESERHGTAVDLDNLGGRLYPGTDERGSYMVDGDVGPYGGCAIREVGGHRRNSGLFEKRNEPRSAEDRHITAAERDCGVGFSHGEVCRPGGADHDLHMSQTVPLSFQSRPQGRGPMNHPIDLVGAAIVSRGPDRLRFFTDGWGDISIINNVTLPTDQPEPIAIEWVSQSTDDGLATSVGIFESPAEILPKHARHGALTRVMPEAGTDRVVVLMAAWNEHDSRARFGIARRLARRGIGSLVLENPYYGIRRPDDHDGQPIRTVADFFRMGIGAVMEGRGLLATIRGAGCVAGVAGYSMGGNMSALVSSTMPFPVATAPLAASYSPSPVYLDGALRGGIAWEALGGESLAEPELREALLAASVLDRPAPDHTRYAVLVSAESDGYVPASTTEALHAHWPGSELRWISGGHATLLWFHKGAFTTAIADSFDRLVAAGATPSR